MNVPVRAATDLRLLRASVFSAVCVALSASGHALASGAVVPLWSLVVGWAGVLCVIGPLAGRERSLPGIATAVLAGEMGVHLLFCLGQTSIAPTSARSAPVVAMAERLQCNPQAAHLTPHEAARIVRLSGLDPSNALPALHHSSGMAGMGGHGGLATMLGSMFTPPMLAAHVTAAVVTGWVLRRCEITLWQAVRLPAVAADHLARLALLHRLSSLLAVVWGQALVTGLLERLLTVLAAHRRTEDGGARRLRSVVLRTCVARRGPPVVALAA